MKAMALTPGPLRGKRRIPSAKMTEAKSEIGRTRAEIGTKIALSRKEDEIVIVRRRRNVSVRRVEVVIKTAVIVTEIVNVTEMKEAQESAVKQPRTRLLMSLLATIAEESQRSREEKTQVAVLAARLMKTGRVEEGIGREIRAVIDHAMSSSKKQDINKVAFLRKCKIHRTCQKRDPSIETANAYSKVIAR